MAGIEIYDAGKKCAECVGIKSSGASVEQLSDNADASLD